MKLVQQLLAEAPRIPGSRFLLGVCLDRVGRHEEALAAYQDELTNNPTHAQAGQRVKLLSEALARPASGKTHWQQRSWQTSLPRETLLSIQHSLHNYTYRGLPMLKNPFDCALYPLLLWKLQPRTIFEIGSKDGGSALWFGDLLESFHIDGHVYSLDIVKPKGVSHGRVTFLEANGRALGQTLDSKFLQGLPRPWLVIEDADHSYPTSSAVLGFFHPWLQPHEYIVIEDGIISDLVEGATGKSGPHLALKEFLNRHNAEYEIDADYCDFFGLNVTWCTNGFLKKLDAAVSPKHSLLNQSNNQEVQSGSPLAPRHVSQDHIGARKQALLNLGCGARFHPGWVNMDLAPTDPTVLRLDVQNPLPFKDGEFQAVYHSHLLEHLPHQQALPFLQECRRVLASGGVIRIAVPDLETIARLYLKYLEAAAAGEPQAASRYEWMTLELLDQMVRERSGGEMLEYWKQNPMPAEEFVLQRMGQEARNVLQRLRAPGAVPLPDPPKGAADALTTGKFRQGGEAHKWMYDRFSLGKLLRKAGFADIQVCAANQSRIAELNSFLLDVTEQGSTRKPDSLFMEAIKPPEK